MKAVPVHWEEDGDISRLCSATDRMIAAVTKQGPGLYLAVLYGGGIGHDDSRDKAKKIVEEALGVCEYKAVTT